MRFDTPTADRVAALVFFALGAAMTYGGFVMDRLEIRQIHPASIPGLVPMILGGALMLCAVLLGLGAENAHDRDADGPDVGWNDLFVSLALCCVYALGLVGNLPFGVATAIFVAVFSGWFMWPEADADRAARLKVAVGAAVFGVAVATATALLFRYAFLVRLP